jgi:hypothetical protein
MDLGQQKLPELHHLRHDPLLAGVGGMDVEDEVAARRRDFIFELDREYQSDHGCPRKWLRRALRVARQD